MGNSKLEMTNSKQIQNNKSIKFKTLTSEKKFNH